MLPTLIVPLRVVTAESPVLFAFPVLAALNVIVLFELHTGNVRIRSVFQVKMPGLTLCHIRLPFRLVATLLLFLLPSIGISLPFRLVWMVLLFPLMDISLPGVIRLSLRLVDILPFFPLMFAGLKLLLLVLALSLSLPLPFIRVPLRRHHLLLGLRLPFSLSFFLFVGLVLLLTVDG
jgi:hypothetical protein